MADLGFGRLMEALDLLRKRRLVEHTGFEVHCWVVHMGLVVGSGILLVAAAGSEIVGVVVESIVGLLARVRICCWEVGLMAGHCMVIDHGELW